MVSSYVIAYDMCGKQKGIRHRESLNNNDEFDDSLEKQRENKRGSGGASDGAFLVPCNEAFCFSFSSTSNR